MMISTEQNYPDSIDVMQAVNAATSVNQVESSIPSSSTIYDNNQCPDRLTETKSFSSLRIRLGLRCLCSFDDKLRHRSFIDRIFSTDQENNDVISDHILRQCLQRTSSNRTDRTRTILILHGQYERLRPLETRIVSSLRTHFIEENYHHQHSSSSNNSTPILTVDFRRRSIENSLDEFYLISGRELFDQFELTLSSTNDQQKHSLHLSKNRSTTNVGSFLHRLRRQISENDFLYIFADVENVKELKFWKKFREKLVEMSSVEEIWVDGPLCKKKNEVWIDAPPKVSNRKKIRLKSLRTKLKRSPSSNSSKFECESVVSSHCHLPVLPVFKDHSLLPFRSKRKSFVRSSSPKLDLKQSANKLNDDLENLSKTLENLLVSSRLDQFSNSMSNDEKNHRLSRIVSPTRFEKFRKISDENPTRPSVPNSPKLAENFVQIRSSSRKPSTPVRTSSLSKTARPTIFQRIFGLTTNFHPETNDDFLPATSSAASSSSSGYESLSIGGHDENQFHRNIFTLKQRRNQLKTQLANTGKFQLETTESSTPLHRLVNNFDEEKQLEQEIDFLQRRLFEAKNQLVFIKSNQ